MCNQENTHPPKKGELDVNSKLTEEEGRVASFLSSIFKEVPCKLPGSLSELVQTVLPGANIPPTQVSAREQHTPLWGQPSGGVDPGARPC